MVPLPSGLTRAMDADTRPQETGPAMGKKGAHRVLPFTVELLVTHKGWERVGWSLSSSVNNCYSEPY